MNAPARVTNLYREETSYIKNVIHRCKILLNEALRNDDEDQALKQATDIEMLQAEVDQRELKELDNLFLDIH